MKKLNSRRYDAWFISLVHGYLLSHKIAHSLVHQQYWSNLQTQARIHRLPSNKEFSPSCKRRASPLMYFDDVSRYSAPWQQDGDDWSDWEAGISPSKKRELQQRAIRDKMKAVRRLIGSYDDESTGQLSIEEVKDKMYEWATEKGVVGAEFGNEVYTSILWMNVLEEETIPGILSGFWQAIMDVITVGEICEAESIDWKNIESSDCNTDDKVYMIVVPKCAKLYDYNTMAKLHRAIEYCQDFCSHFGKKFTLTHFHPSYLNAPHMWHPLKNSPFPCFGLQFKSINDEVNKLENMFDLVEVDPSHDELLEEQRFVLESLFNSASVSSSSDVMNDSYGMNIKDFVDGDFVEITSNWLDEHKYTSSESSMNQMNKALELSDSIQEWKVIYDESAEEVYTHLWKAVSSLLQRAGTTETNGETGAFSIMFILPKFEVFSSERFKRFAVSVNASLRLFVGDKISLEIFHPEYLGTKRNYDALRRAPFPCIQISHRGN